MNMENNHDLIINNQSKLIKEIYELVESNYLVEAEKSLREYIRLLSEENNLLKKLSEQYLSEDLLKELENLYEVLTNKYVEVYSIKAVIAIGENKLDEAENFLKEGLQLNINSFDINYNLAYVYQLKNNEEKQMEFYKNAYELCKDNELKENIKLFLNDKGINLNKKKIAFFVKQGLDTFLDDIINGLSNEYETKKIIVTEYSQIDEGMNWADICWFEWCDELIAYGSKNSLATIKNVVCRLHRYEAFTSYPNEVIWENVDKVIFVAEHIRDMVIEKAGLDKDKCIVLPNGIDMNKFNYKQREKGFNIAWIGYLNLRKNPMLVIQYFNEIVKKDNRYKLYIAGSFQDVDLKIYLEDMIERLSLSNNVIFEGFMENSKIAEWLEDKHYIVTGSISEGHPVGVMEAMASGLKPVIHYFPGSEQFYPKEYLYYDLEGFNNCIVENEYNSKEYRKFIEENYSLDKQISSIRNILFEFENTKSYNVQNIKLPLVSVCIPVYNGEKYIKYTIDSVLKQTYKNIEIIISDNCSTDNTVKIIESYDDKRIKLFKNQNNIGVLRNSNRCVQLSSGDYIKFVYADDIIHENTIEEMVTVMEANPEISLSSVNFCHIDKENNIISKSILKLDSGRYEGTLFFKQLVINGNIIGCPSGVMIRKHKLNITGLFSDELRYMADYDMWIRLCKVGDYYFINKDYMYFRIQSESLTNHNIASIKRVSDFYYLLNKYLDNANFKEKEIVNAYNNANQRCYYSLEKNNNLNEKLEIIDYILKNSKYIHTDEKLSLIDLKKNILSII